MFRREFGAATRGRRPILYRAAIAIVLLIALVPFGAIAFADGPSDDLPGRLTLLGRGAFLAVFGVEMLCLAVFIPAFAGGAIAEEREKDTLPLLLLTRTRPIEIAATKLLARTMPVLSLACTGVPVLVGAAWMGGLDRELLFAVAVLLSGAWLMAALATLASARREQAASARAMAAAWIFGWLLLPIVTLMPVRATTLWGELLAELKNLCALVAPSSPLSLATDRGWYFRPNAPGLGERVALMIGLQLAFGLVALAFAASNLKARERNPNWMDPTRGFRPPCGDDPIYWREYELPMRRGGGSLIRLRLRYVWIHVRAILITLLGLLALLILLAIPLGLLFATLYYGIPAFQEVWQHGYGAGGPFTERSRFNFVIRAATGALALFPALSMGALVAGRITTERDKKTWESLLTTPLEGREILRSKALAALHGLGQSAWPLPILWVLGLACGAVTPLGVLFAAADLTVAIWANLALGLSLSLRPGPTATASSRVASLTLLFLLVQTPVLYGALASPSEFAAMATWDSRLRGGLILAALGVPAVIGTVAWRLTRQTLDRFDEWVGRPREQDGLARAK